MPDMTNDDGRWRRVRELFEQALPLAPAGRIRLLQGEADASVVHEVGSLLAAVREDGFLESPPIELGALMGGPIHADRTDGGLGEESAGAGIEEPDALLGQRIGSYVVMRRLGVGGMGVVYEALQENPRRTVALKLVRPDLVSRETVARFRREGELLGRLQHPGIAAIHEAGTFVDDRDPLRRPRPFCAMELVEGDPIVEWADGHRLDTARRLDLLAQVCDAVDHAHRRGVIHRDLKPANILVASTGQPKVLDFGIARALETSPLATMQTVAGSIVGTLTAMSPEQLRGDVKAIDARADVYALGVLAYELLGGRPPFELGGAGVAESIHRLLEAEPTSLAQIRRDLRGDIAVVVGKAMAKDPGRRYQTASAFASDLRACRDSRPVAARPPSASYLLHRFARRHRSAIAAGVTAVLLLAATAVGASIGWRRAALQAQRVRQVNAYLTGMLDWLDPAQTGGPDTSLLAALDQAALRLDSDLAGEPEVAATIHDTLGERFFTLGAFERAEFHHRTAAGLRADLFGPESAEVADSLVALGQSLRARFRFRESIEAQQNALRIRRRLEGERGEGVAECLNNIGTALATAGHHREAVPILEESVAVAKRNGGIDPLKVATLMGNYGMALLGCGRTEEALRAVDESIALRNAVHGEDLESAKILANMVMVMHHGSGADQVEPLLRRILQIRRRLLPADHADLELVRSNLAEVLAAAGRPEEAAQLKEESLAAQRAAGRLDAAFEAHSLVKIAELWEQAGEGERAESSRRRAAELGGESVSSTR